MVRTCVAGIYPHRDHVSLVISQNLKIRQKTWRDRVRDQTGNAFFQHQRIGNPADVPSTILNTDQNRPASNVRECNDSPQQPIGRRQVPLELERLALGTTKGFQKIHYLEVY